MISLQPHGQRRNIAIATAIAILLASVFPPFHITLANRNIALGYSFLLSPPLYNGSRELVGSVDLSTLVVEYVGILAIGAIASLLPPWRGLFGKTYEFKLPPYVAMALRALCYTVAIVLALSVIVFMKMLGPIVLIIYGSAVIIYFVGKVVVPVEKNDLLLAMAAMGAHACWILSAGAFLLIQEDRSIFVLDGSRILYAAANFVLPIVYFAGIVWFIRKPSLRSTAVLLLYVGFLFFLKLSTVPFLDLTTAASKGVGLQIVISAFVFLTLPASYYEYSTNRRALPALTPGEGKSAHGLDKRRLLTNVGAVIVGLIVVVAIFGGLFMLMQRSADEALRLGNEASGQMRYADALNFYRSAADQGSPRAKYNIGALYANGSGVPKDYDQSRYWYGLAAAQGLDEAKKKLLEPPIAFFLDDSTIGVLPLKFNVDLARKAGHSDTAIAEFLVTKFGFDLAAARKAGYSDTIIVDTLTRTTPPPPTSTSNIRAQSADGVIHEFPPGTDPTVIDKAMREYSLGRRSSLPK